jgi:hypothetical protein
MPDSARVRGIRRTKHRDGVPQRFGQRVADGADVARGARIERRAIFEEHLAHAGALQHVQCVERLRDGGTCR